MACPKPAPPATEDQVDTALVNFAALSFPAIDPVIVEIGPLAIRWYGLAYVVGLYLAWQIARRIAATPRLWHNERPAVTVAELDDFLFFAVLGVVLGGRIGYILFYDLAAVLANPFRALEIWNGGMSFHGGLLGTLLAMVLFARSRAIPLFPLFDVVCAVAPVGLFFGRLANFINGELWGRITDVPWAFVFPAGGPFARHPTQLYEAVLEGLVLFSVLMVLVWRRGSLRRPGLTAGVFAAGYAASRIAVEFFREPDAHIGYLAGSWLTMGMVLSLPLALAGLWAIATSTRRVTR